MSKISGKTRHESFQEWHKWAKKQYPSFNVKRNKPTPSIWLMSDYNEY